MNKVTLFPKLTDPGNAHVKTLESTLNAIKDPNASVKSKVEKIRTTKDKSLREELKKELPIICFGGTFTERRASALVEYSKIICLDFDEIECLEDLEEELKANEYVYALWRSPSGIGLKALIQVSTDNHLGHALALLKDFPEADPNAIKDVNRATYLSWDVNLYHNPKARIYDRVVLPKYTDDQKYDNLKKWLENKGEQFVSGQRNSFIVKLSAAANRFGVDKEFLIQQIEFDFLKGSDFAKREMVKTVNGVYSRYQSQNNTVLADEVWTDKKVEEVMRVEDKSPDIILVRDIMPELIKDFEEGTPGGESTYFPELDKIFRWMRGEKTTMTGVSSAGKSIMLLHLLVVKAIFDNQKFGVLSMEQYPPIYFYREIARMLTGKPLEKDQLTRMSFQEYSRALEWINEHFYFIYPAKDDPTPEWTLGRFYEAIIKYGIDGCVVDPYNSQSHDYKSAGGRDDRYIASMLRKNQRFALQNDVYFIDVAHPRGIGKNEDGTYREPTADEISGGPAWWQCSDNILIQHRPSLPLDFKDTTCTLTSSKIKKQPSNGRPGKVTFNYDWKSCRYYDENGFNPLTKFKL